MGETRDPALGAWTVFEGDEAKVQKGAPVEAGARVNGATIGALWVDDRLVYVRDDGGRAEAGFRGDTGDCVVRAVAVAAALPYRTVYDELAARMGAAGHARTPRNGVYRRVYTQYLAELGFVWTPTMSIGSGCVVHLRADELPPGRLIVRLSKHLAAVIDGVLHDTYDCSREGTRCVYGIWARP